MRKLLSTLVLVFIVAITTAFTLGESKIVSKKGHINFFSHTSLEDISADNYKVVSTLDKVSGEVVFSVPMQSFEFVKAKMQQHYNSPKFLDTKKFPKAKFKGKISNIGDVDFTKDGSYTTDVSGELELHGVTKPISEKGKITISGGKIVVDSKMELTLADYEIAFTKGKPSTNVAKTIDITIKTEFEQ